MTQTTNLAKGPQPLNGIGRQLQSRVTSGLTNASIFSTLWLGLFADIFSPKMLKIAQECFDSGSIFTEWAVRLINSIHKTSGTPTVDRLRPMALQDVKKKWLMNGGRNLPTAHTPPQGWMRQRTSNDQPHLGSKVRMARYVMWASRKL